ncbi:MAG: 5-(carboxyamino)imidazole ribonucleotide mutase [Acidobacteria bacterium]|nr:5-(carboxyamino)imidazole ribonucleotide mutase [Acidobacteriota bacterium]
MKSAKAPARVGIVMGSDSDLAVMGEASRVLEEFGVASEITVASAHRSPARVERYAASVDARGIQVLIAGAAGAAHLAGVLAALTTVPVIAVPLASSPLGGFDALLASVQMPPGVPVAVTSVGPWGARNAAILAVQILATGDPALKKKLADHKKKMADDVERKAAKVENGS